MPTILLTGSTGHVGFQTLLHALREGYSVRAAVRSEQKAASIRAHPSVIALSPGYRLDIVIVPDITESGAFDKVVGGCDFIIHIASPLATSNKVNAVVYGDYFIRPAVAGTLGILEAAKRSGRVRRVVITSSISALIPFEVLEGQDEVIAPVLPTDRIPLDTGPYPSEFAAYAASKVAALQAAELWMDMNAPSFDVTYLHPSFIEGRNDLATCPREALNGTNGIVLGIALGQTFETFIGATVHNEDVAMAHVRALDWDVPSNRSYVLSQPSHWNDVQTVVERDFPDAPLPKSGEVNTVKMEVDTSETEWAFKFKFTGFDEQVRSVVGHFLELRKRHQSEGRLCKHESRVDSVLDVGSTS
ncbi:NAD dependent epimerase/dehydratase [Rhizodiscina lignyota]|uniref:NAD dependent epimerase/dehydratase n=1 Tax=Rhizodiscina lignyota TaxID=1504668 RepID=A0A9P4M3U7_9PEZI|nr:NAD dependent epimerase/dehydratase [Rhizodiscina lignyota]